MRKARVIHVVRSMNRGGVETWLMNVLRRIDKQAINFSFLVGTSEPGDFDQEIRDLGCCMHLCEGHRDIAKYYRKLSELFHREQCDVIHSHVHAFSGVVLGVAKHAGIRERIAHSHSDARASAENNLAIRQGYRSMMRLAIRRYKTKGLAASAPAAEDLFGRTWRTDPTIETHYCGINVDEFSEKVETAAMRVALRIPQDALVIGHVGNFVPAKNHSFLVRIAHCVMQRNERVWLLLVGDGALRSQTELVAGSLGIMDRTVFAGKRSDVPKVLSAMDVFVMPSKWEGLPLAAIEAQAAGLPCVLSTTITREVALEGSHVRFVDPNETVARWADVILRSPAPLNRERNTRALSLVLRRVDVQNSVDRLAQIYLGTS